jgi:DNA modification methylase
MKTSHSVYIEDAGQMASVADASIALVVTSPPYPMIEMWDQCFTGQDPAIGRDLSAGQGFAAFEKMHGLLDRAWQEVYRVLTPGGIACINIGDATRTLNQNFVLYPNHARIISGLLSMGFAPLPEILWRKQTNAPNKFMGSGMLPPGAYVTLEHEHILVVRKGEKREFPNEALKQNRRESAYFWEERNQWFSDIWMDLKGARQDLGENETRKRSAAFPFELPYRLISMFSVKGDTVLDPFMGTGTTMAAAMAAGRDSIGVEREPGFLETIRRRTDGIVSFSNERIRERLAAHEAFIRERYEAKGGFKYPNRHYGFPVVTSQEASLLLNNLKKAKPLSESSFEVTYQDTPQEEFCSAWEGYFNPATRTRPVGRPRKAHKPENPVRPKQQNII